MEGGGGHGVETEACNLTGNSASDGQPVKMSEYWSDVNTDYKTGCTALDSLKFAYQELRETSQEICNSQCLKVQEKQQKFW